MEVIIRPTTEEAVRLTAELIADAIRQKPFFKLGLATGATMEAVYADLAEMNKAGRVDFSRVHTFNLAAYIGLPPADPHSYRYYMNKHLFSKNYGMGGALSVFLFIITGVLSLIVFRFNKTNDGR